MLWYPGPETVLWIKLDTLKGAGHCVPLRPVCAPWGEFSFRKHGASRSSQARREEGQRCRIRRGEIPEWQANSFDCRKGPWLCSWSNGKIFPVWEIPYGLTQFKKPENYGSRKTKVKDTSLQEKSRRWSKLFSKPHVLFQILVLSMEVVKRKRSFIVQNSQASKFIVNFNKPLYFNRSSATNGLWCAPCKTWGRCI